MANGQYNADDGMSASLYVISGVLFFVVVCSRLHVACCAALCTFLRDMRTIGREGSECGPHSLFVCSCSAALQTNFPAIGAVRTIRRDYDVMKRRWSSPQH